MGGASKAGEPVSLRWQVGDGAQLKSIMENTTHNASDFVSHLISGQHSALRLAAGLLGLALVAGAAGWFFAQHR